jgi:hypothetical protein
MNTSSARVWLRAGLAAALVVSIALSAGCGGSKNDGKISGQVTYGGEVVGGGNVLLQASGEHAQTLRIPINAEGTYQLGGVAPGEYFVGVETDSVKALASGNPYGGPAPPGVKMGIPKFDHTPKYVPLPPKYKDPKTSGLPKITVQRGSNAPQNIDIPKS